MTTKIGLIGLGAAARAIHVPACAKLKSAEIVAGADPDPAQQSRFLELVRSARVFPDAKQLLEAARPDWAIIATPPSTHFELCSLALKSGCNVFCEKPFVEDASQGERLAELERSTGLRVVANHEFPHMDIFACIPGLLESPRLGRPLFLQFWQHLWEAPLESGNWRSENRTLREFGTHVIDLAIFVYGALPERIFARMASPGSTGGSDLVDIVTLDFPDGRLASIVLDRVSKGPHRYLEMRLDGEHSSMRASFGGRAQAALSFDTTRRRPMFSVEFAGGGQAWLERDNEREVVAKNSLSPFADATARHMEDAFLCLRQGREPRASIAHALDVVRIVQAGYDSARIGQPVALR